MPTFKNITEIDSTTCKILLYGAIGPDEAVSASSFVGEMDHAAQFFKKAHIHIHCLGGDVLEGIAIRSALINSKMDIEIYVDGVAASLGFVLAMCGKPVFMGKYSRLMAHRVNGGGSGNVEEMKRMIDDMESIENDLVSMLADKTGMTAEEIKTKWFDGFDHWIKADEAMALGLIAGIYDGAEFNVEDSLYTSNAKDTYNKITNILNLNTKNMKWENFFKRAGLKNEATEQEAIDGFDKIEKRAADAEAEKAKLEKENKELKDKLDAKDKIDADKEAAEILETVENAVKEGRIKADLKESFVDILKSNKVKGMAVLNAMPKGKRLMTLLASDAESNDPEGSEKWTFSMWQAKGGKLLGEMKANEPERYKALYKATFKKEPVM